MYNLEWQVDTLMRLCSAQTPAEQTQARQALRLLVERSQPPAKDPEDLVGHPYVVEAVLMAVENRYYINNVTFGLYPQIAAKFDTTATRVERGIRHLIEVTWLRGDMEILTRYFGNTIDPERGKPTNGEFIARLANIVNMQLKQAS